MGSHDWGLLGWRTNPGIPFVRSSPLFLVQNKELLFWFPLPTYTSMLLQDTGPALPYVSARTANWPCLGLSHPQTETVLEPTRLPYLLLQSGPHPLLAQHIPKIGKGSALPMYPLVRKLNKRQASQWLRKCKRRVPLLQKQLHGWSNTFG